MNVLPFTYFDGFPTLRDSDLALLFEKMERDGTTPVVFRNQEIDARRFINYMKQPGVHLFVVEEDVNPLGFGWVDYINGDTGFAHFCSFSEAWGTKTVEMGNLLARKMLAALKLRILIGFVPKDNWRALEATLRSGFKSLGDLPNDSFVVYFSE